MHNLLSIYQTLRPADSTQHAEALWLDNEGNGETLGSGVDTKRYTGYRPYQHHSCRESFGTLCAEVAPYLRK
jgi:hypothetical protein